MHPIELIRLVLAIAVLSSLTLFSTSVLACSCAPPQSPQVALEDAAAVFSGKAIARQPLQEVWPVPERVTFLVDQVWKGPEWPNLSVETIGISSACGYHFELGEEYLVYAVGSANDLTVWFCSRTRLLSEAAVDLEALGDGVMIAPLIEELVSFYQRYDGDNWLRNDGWLDPEVPICHWHGVMCNQDLDLYALDLPRNNLHGSIAPNPTADLLALGMEGGMHLAGNRISGEIQALEPWMHVLDLSDNELSGTLPDILDTLHGPGWAPLGARFTNLDLSGNRFDGEIPPSWLHLQGLEFLHLDLSANRLEGTVDLAFDLFKTPAILAGYLNLANNRFSGMLTGAVSGAKLLGHDGHYGHGGGLNLCWNELEIESPAISQWLGSRHVGGEAINQCLNRETLDIDTSLSGSWYSPARPGEGLTIQIMDNGQPLVYWFSFDLDGRQQWLFETGKQDESMLRWHQLLETRGRFAQGFEHPEHPWLRVSGRLQVDRIGPDQVHVERIFHYDWLGPEQGLDCDDPPPFWPNSLACPHPNNSLSDRHDYARLTRLAGTRCSDQIPEDWISGAWYDPQRAGEGFVVEVIAEDGRGVVYWYSYQPDNSGRQAWMVGDGYFEGDTLHIENLMQPLGGVYGPDFDPGAIELLNWGNLTMTFFDDDSGHVWWESVLPEYGSGDYPLQRLSRPALATCD